jgi:hypothetical protein
MMAAKIVSLRPRIVERNRRLEPKRLKKADRLRFEKLWRAAVRNTVKQLPCPPAFADVLSCFNAALNELQGGRDLCIAVGAARRTGA